MTHLDRAKLDLYCQLLDLDPDEMTGPEAEIMHELSKDPAIQNRLRKPAADRWLLPLSSAHVEFTKRVK